MQNHAHYLNTSVSDAKGSLQLEARARPHTTGLKALQLMADIAGQGGHVSRRKMLAGIVRQAGKALAEREELHPRGPRAGDPYVERTTNGQHSLREMIDQEIERDAHQAAAEILQALHELSGETGHATRRTQLRTGLNQALRHIAEAA